MGIFQIEIYTSMERNPAISIVRQGLISREGWISNHQLFSNKLASIAFEMPSDGLAGFLADLKSAGLKPQYDAALPAVGDREITGTIALTFLHDEPDMKREVPAFG